MQGEAIAETNQALGFELQFIEATKVKQPITFTLYPNPSTGLVNLNCYYSASVKKACQAYLSLD